jgi:exportin-2 (importin alpha re-exporter)
MEKATAPISSFRSSTRSRTRKSSTWFIFSTNQWLTATRLYVQLYLNIILPESQKLARPLDRKTAVLSLTKTLANSEAFATRYAKGWGFTCQALLKLLELPPLPASKDDVIAEHDVEDMAFGVGFTALVTIRPQVRDPWPDTGSDLKLWVGKYLKEADQKQGGKISGFVQERLGDQEKAVLGSYIA